MIHNSEYPEERERKKDLMMMKNMEVDHYSVLGLPSGREGAKLSKEEITTAYRRKCKELHPDKRPGNSNAHVDFVILQESYEILKDKSKRKSFDDLVQRMKVDDSCRGSKRPQPEGTSGFQERERKHATPQQEEAKAAGRHEFTRTERFDIDKICRAVFASKKSYAADIPFRSKGVQVSCGRDDQEIRVQGFPMEGV